MSYTDTRFTVSSYAVDGDRENIRYIVFEDTVAIWEGPDQDEARRYADALTANLARLAR